MCKSELNLFLSPPTQTVKEKGQWVQFHPITNIADGGPIEFLIPGSGDAYLDLSQTQLHVRAKIFKSDGKVITNENKSWACKLIFAQFVFSSRRLLKRKNTFL
ncbi:uncharacterized protein F54H12.2 [Trichonephila clavipes]|nr:uncharacterized protein F54H12.2 [Trichonephila clavipes]